MDLHGGKYKLGSHKSVRILKIKSKAQLFAVTDLADEIIEKAKLKPYSDVQSAVDDAVKYVKEKGKEPKVIVITSRNFTVPLVLKK